MDKRLPHRIRDIRLQLQASGKTATADGALSRQLASSQCTSIVGLKGRQKACNHWALVESSKGYLIKLIGRIDDVFRLSLWSWWVCLCCRHSDILFMVSGLS